MEISQATRREIVDILSLSDAHWSGSLDEVEFLSRVYDLTELRSTDPRFRTALGDVRQHRVNWTDWPDDWVFHDPRFNLLRGDDVSFLHFLCETIHPIVRNDADETRILLDGYNLLLSKDGWSLVATNQFPGKPTYVPQKAGQRLEVFDEPTGWDKADRQIEEARSDLRTATTEEQFQTVGLVCREAIISVAQEVFDPTLHKASDGIVPSATDANRMLEGFFNFELPGPSNQAVRAYAKAALNLALALQHKRTADFRTAALCLEAAVSTVNIVAVIAGRR